MMTVKDVNCRGRKNVKNVLMLVKVAVVLRRVSQFQTHLSLSYENSLRSYERVVLNIRKFYEK